MQSAGTLWKEAAGAVQGQRIGCEMDDTTQRSQFEFDFAGTPQDVEHLLYRFAEVELHRSMPRPTSVAWRDLDGDMHVLENFPKVHRLPDYGPPWRITYSAVIKTLTPPPGRAKEDGHWWSSGHSYDAFGFDLTEMHKHTRVTAWSIALSYDKELSRRIAVLGAEWPGRESEAPRATPPDNVAAALPLSARQQEVANLFASGMTIVEIGEKLVISPNTVKEHLKQIAEVAGCCNEQGKPTTARKLLGPHLNQLGFR